MDKKGATFENTAVALLLDCNGEAGVSSGETGLQGIFDGKEIGETKVTTGLLGSSKREGLKGWKSSSGSERTKKQS